MSKLPDLINGFKMLKQVDVNAIRRQTEAPLHVMVVGKVDEDRNALLKQLLEGPGSDEPKGLLSIAGCRPDQTLDIPENALVLILLDSRGTDYQDQRALFDTLSARRIQAIICQVVPGALAEEVAEGKKPIWTGAETLSVIPADREMLLRGLAQAMLHSYKGDETRLARHVPRGNTPLLLVRSPGARGEQ